MNPALRGEHPRQFERHGFVGGLHGFQGYVEAGAAGVDDALHEVFGGAGASGEAEDGDAVEPGPVNLVGGLDELGVRGAGAQGDLDEADGV